MRTRQDLAQRLAHVRWIGGGSGAGKSTVARRLAERHGVRIYSTDDAMGEHARRSTREGAPLLHAFMERSMDERWVHRSPPEMLATFHWFRGECFDMIVDDLLALPREPRILVEGFRLLPRLVAPLLATPAHAVWLLPTPGFRAAAFASRDAAAPGFVARTSDPAAALRNLLERDRLFTDVLREETARLGLRAIEVDGTRMEKELAERVSQALELH